MLRLDVYALKAVLFIAGLAAMGTVGRMTGQDWLCLLLTAIFASKLYTSVSKLYEETRHV